MIMWLHPQATCLIRTGSGKSTNLGSRTNGIFGCESSALILGRREGRVDKSPISGGDECKSKSKCKKKKGKIFHYRKKTYLKGNSNKGVKKTLLIFFLNPSKNRHKNEGGYKVF